jgi:hypothetical protein
MCETPTFEALLVGFHVEIFFDTHGVAPAEYGPAFN